MIRASVVTSHNVKMRIKSSSGQVRREERGEQAAESEGQTLRWDKFGCLDILGRERKDI
jgi:hypothetical protein